MNETGVFALEIIQHDRWPPDTAEIQALIRVTATPGDHPGDGLTAAGLAEIIIMDCSGSMGKPPGKLRAAKRAAHAAVDTMRDGVEFAVLSGRSRAEAVYPHGPALALSAPDTRDAAKRAIDRLYPNDGTKISSWLRQAHRLLRPYPRHIRHAMLYTDGQNHDLQDGRLDQVLDACRGVFTCDARGIGDQWEPRDLRKIVTVLQGRADGLPDPADLEDDFRVVMREAMRKVVPSVALRIRTRPGVSVREIRQMYPADADLTGHGTAADTTATDFWIGSWSDETRDYMVRLGVAPGDFAIGKEVRLARVDVTVPGPDGPRILPGPGFIVACWTRDDLSMRTWLT
jgi:hypothetical protein